MSGNSGSTSSPSSVGRMVARMAMVALFAAAAIAAQMSAHYGLGDSVARVKQIQGAPESREVLPSLGLEIWSWDNASVTFDLNTHRLLEWRDPQRVLRVALRPALTSRDSVIALDDSLADVVRIHGTPWALTQGGTGRPTYLAYGLSVVRIGTTGRVEGWRRRDDMLHVSVRDDSLARAHFGTPPALGVSRKGARGNPSTGQSD